MKQTALQRLIDIWNKELQEPLGVLQGDKDYHFNDLKRAVRQVREINKRIDQATELLETEREDIEEAYEKGCDNAADWYSDPSGENFTSKQYYKYTYE